MEFINLALKVIASILASLIAAFTITKSWKELTQFNKGRRRTEYEFAKRLAQDTNDQHLKRYADELGYAALIGDNYLTHAQRKYLLSLPESEHICRQFESARGLLTVCVTPGTEGLQWKNQKFTNKRIRSLTKYIFISVWMLCASVTFLPALFWSFLSPQPKMPSEFWVAQTLFLAYFVPLMILIAVEGRRFRNAEDMMREHGTKKSPTVEREVLPTRTPPHDTVNS